MTLHRPQPRRTITRTRAPHDVAGPTAALQRGPQIGAEQRIPIIRSTATITLCVLSVATEPVVMLGWQSGPTSIDRSGPVG